VLNESDGAKFDHAFSFFPPSALSFSCHLCRLQSTLGSEVLNPCWSVAQGAVAIGGGKLSREDVA
jgi:hypothetical protein